MFLRYLLLNEGIEWFLISYIDKILIILIFFPLDVAKGNITYLYYLYLLIYIIYITYILLIFAHNKLNKC